MIMRENWTKSWEIKHVQYEVIQLNNDVAHEHTNHNPFDILATIYAREGDDNWSRLTK